MGWGICFDLDANGRVYCADGCKWRATKADYANYPVWPSAQSAVLEYFEDEAGVYVLMPRAYAGVNQGVIDAWRMGAVGIISQTSLRKFLFTT